MPKVEHDISGYFVGPDADIIATHLVESTKKNNKEKSRKDKKNKRREKRKAKLKKIPQKVELVNMVTGVSVTDTITGSSTLTVTMVDPDYRLIESGFFDADDDGKLDPLDLEYPEDSNLWWRLTQVGLTDSSGSGELTLTWLERAAVHLASHHGPLKVSRGKKTRAQFLKMCADKVKANGGIDFHSRQLKVKQDPKGAEGKAKEGEGKVKTPDQKKKDKDPGIHKDSNLTIKGAKMSAQQIKVAQTSLDVASDLNAPEKACLALLVAEIQESGMANLGTMVDLDSLGVLQVRVSTSGSRDKSLDVEWCVRQFLTKGFWGKGGAISLAKSNPGQSPGWIAQQCQGSAYPSAYDPHMDEAEAILEAYGGGGFGGASGTWEKREYNFEIGTTENPNEDMWEGMQRIAEEVNWCLFLNGQDLYYDSELTLIKQKPALILRRGGASLVTYEMTWDVRQICTDLSVELICAPFEFRAGDVFKLEGFGPASSGSTAKPPLPGRWLVAEIERDMSTFSSRFTLKQPERPLKEPKAEVTKGEYGSDAAGSTASGPIRDRIVQIAKDSVRPYFYSQSGALTAKVHPGQGNRSDCSQWARACYLTAGAGDPGTYTGDMLSRGKTTSSPKPGDLLCSPSHVELFIGSGKTIGHGSDPIDYDTVSGVKGRDSSMRFITYDFLDK